MRTLFVLTLIFFSLIFFSLLNKKCQTQAIVPLAGTTRIPCKCGEADCQIVSSSDTEEFTPLNQTNFEIRFIIPRCCVLLYVVTSIDIIVENQMGNPNVREYYITYRLNDSIISNKLELAGQTVDGQNTLTANITQLLIITEELSIWWFGNMNNLVKYVIRGYNIPRVADPGYLIPSIIGELVGKECNNELCYIYRNEGISGMKGSGFDVKWKCNDTSGCGYTMEIRLTSRVNVFHLVFIRSGTTNDNSILNIRVIKPINRIINSSDNFTHPIMIPINGETDYILLHMNIPMRKQFILRDIEVISYGMNREIKIECNAVKSISILPQTPIPCQYISSTPSTSQNISSTPSTSQNISSTPSTSQNISSTPTISQNNEINNSSFSSIHCNQGYNVMGLVIGIMLLMIIVSTTISIYLFIKYRNVRHQLDLVKPLKNEISLNNCHSLPNNNELSQYPEKSPNPDVYYSKIIYQEGLESKAADHGRVGTTEVITNERVDDGELVENPIYAGEIIPGIETSETQLQIPIESCQETNPRITNEKKFEEEREKPESPVYYEMRDNPLYKEVAIKSQDYEGLDSNPGDLFSAYDSLRH